MLIEVGLRSAVLVNLLFAAISNFHLVMRVLGIDPSFTRTGLSILDSDLGVTAYTSIEVPRVLKG